MKKLSLVLCLLCGNITAGFAAALDMTLDFTWIGTDLRTPRPHGPEFQVDHAPEGPHRFGSRSPVRMGGSVAGPLSLGRRRAADPTARLPAPRPASAELTRGRSMHWGPMASLSPPPR